MKKALLKFALSSAIVFAAPAAVMAQTASSPATTALTPELQTILDSLSGVKPLRFPAVFGAPSAVAPAGGTGFVALTYVNPRSGISGNGSDGDLTAGYTIGDAAKNVSVTFGVSVISLDGFGDDGSLFVSASRQVHAGPNSSTFVGVEASTLAGWGDVSDTPEAYTAQVSHLTSIATASGQAIPMQFTIGYGNETTVADDGSGSVDNGAFVGVGFGLSEFVSGSVSATETQVNLGVGVSIPTVPNLGISAGFFDVTDNTDRRQFSLTAAFSF